MEYKLFIYPNPEPKCIIEHWSPSHFIPGDQLILDDKKYQVLSVRHIAREIKFSSEGVRNGYSGPKVGEVIDPLRDYFCPEITVTEVSPY